MSRRSKTINESQGEVTPWKLEDVRNTDFLNTGQKIPTKIRVGSL